MGFDYFHNDFYQYAVLNRLFAPHVEFLLLFLEQHRPMPFGKLHNIVPLPFGKETSFSPFRNLGRLFRSAHLSRCFSGMLFAEVEGWVIALRQPPCE